MERRDILKASAVFLGYSLVGGASIAVLNGCKADTSTSWKPSFFTMDQVNMLAEVAERIIPRTDTPGAKDAMVDRYIDEAVGKNYTKEEQDQFMAGIATFDKMANDKYGRNFLSIGDADKDRILQTLADAAKKASKNGDNSPQVFSAVKSLVVTGYFTSEAGATKALVYDPIPGPYQGCVSLSEVGGAYSL